MARTFGFPVLRLRQLRRRARLDSAESEAEALILVLGAAAYGEARRRADEASSDAIARDWDAVAQAVARKTGSEPESPRYDRLAARVALVPDREQAPSSPPAEVAEAVLQTQPQWFRIQFAGAPPERGPSILKEVEIRAPDVSSAIVAAAAQAWPRGTTALRILDQEGREVFERHKAGRQ
jgi:hypothetical protein